MSELLVIGEVGINHNGSLMKAKRLIDMAKDCGCDVVKFQKRTIDTVYTREFLDSYRESPFGTTQRHQKEALEFGKEEYDEIHQYCAEKDIMWFASAWDIKSQEFLSKYNLSFNKIASAMLTNKPFIQKVAMEHRHTFISTGGSTHKDIDWVVNEFKSKQTPFTLMHAVSTYPCRDEDCNIRMVNTLAKKYRCEIGYSGHERGLTPSLLAVTLGATVIERHITLDRTSYGSDQSASLEKRGLEVLVREARLIKSMLGDGEKRILSEERDVMKKLRYFEKSNYRYDGKVAYG